MALFCSPCMAGSEQCAITQTAELMQQTYGSCDILRNVELLKKRGKNCQYNIDLHNRDNSYQRARPCDVICLSRLKYLQNKKKRSRNCQIIFLKIWEGVCRILLCCSQFLRGIWLGIERRLASLFRQFVLHEAPVCKSRQKKKKNGLASAKCSGAIFWGKL